MNEIDPLVDYYKVLECERSASFEELKKSYQRLVLTSHPDKINNRVGEEGFLRIQKAWSVLRDPQSRKQYDAVLTCQEHSECLLYDTVSLSDMEFNQEDDTYTMPCRCGGTYVLEAQDSHPKQIIIGCDECSFSILINVKL